GAADGGVPVGGGHLHSAPPPLNCGRGRGRPLHPSPPPGRPPHLSPPPGRGNFGGKAGGGVRGVSPVHVHLHIRVHVHVHILIACSSSSKQPSSWSSPRGRCASGSAAAC